MAAKTLLKDALMEEPFVIQAPEKAPVKVCRPGRDLRMIKDSGLRTLMADCGAATCVTLDSYYRLADQRNKV